MYDLYKQTCEKEKNTYVKSSYYRYIFNTSFNINFHVPKTDRCEKCEEVRIKKTEKITMTDEEKEQHEKHLAETIAMREDKVFASSIRSRKCYNLAKSGSGIFLLQEEINSLQSYSGDFVKAGVLRNLDGVRIRTCWKRYCRRFYPNHQKSCYVPY